MDSSRQVNIGQMGPRSLPRDTGQARFAQPSQLFALRTAFPSIERQQRCWDVTGAVPWAPPSPPWPCACIRGAGSAMALWVLCSIAALHASGQGAASTIDMAQSQKDLGCLGSGMHRM